MSPNDVPAVDESLAGDTTATSAAGVTPAPAADLSSDHPFLSMTRQDLAVFGEDVSAVADALERLSRPEREATVSIGPGGEVTIRAGFLFPLPPPAHRAMFDSSHAEDLLAVVDPVPALTIDEWYAFDKPDAAQVDLEDWVVEQEDDEPESAVDRTHSVSELVAPEPAQPNPPTCAKIAQVEAPISTRSILELVAPAPAADVVVLGHDPDDEPAPKHRVSTDKADRRALAEYLDGLPYDGLWDADEDLLLVQTIVGGMRVPKVAAMMDRPESEVLQRWTLLTATIKNGGPRYVMGKRLPAGNSISGQANLILELTKRAAA